MSADLSRSTDSAETTQQRPIDSDRIPSSFDGDSGAPRPCSAECTDADKDGAMSPILTSPSPPVPSERPSDEDGAMSPFLTSPSPPVPSERPSDDSPRSQRVMDFLTKRPEVSTGSTSSSSSLSPSPWGPCSLCQWLGRCRGCERPFFGYHLRQLDPDILSCDLDYPNTPPGSSWHRGDVAEDSNSSPSAKRARHG